MRALALLALLAAPAWAAKISELEESGWRQQLERFFRFGDPAVVYALSRAILLGLVSGLLGAFIVLRGMSLMGDTLGHAVLPGVAAAFMVTGQKAMVPLMVGASLAGVLGTGAVWAVRRYSRLKEDAAMGLVLSSFFALGIVLLTRIQKSESGAQSGLDRFLFGQAATLGLNDVIILALVTVFCLGLVGLLFKELTVTSFDPVFAASIGLPVGWLNALLMGLVTLAVVASIPAVGVVLVSAMLITPAATAQLLSRRMPTMLAWSAVIGVLSGALGALFSFLARGMPTGPCMVLAASCFFLAAYLLAPERGLLIRAWRRAMRRHRTERENLVKSIYRSQEDRDGAEWITLDELARDRRESVSDLSGRVRGLGPLVIVSSDRVRLSDEGRALAERLVRNHRLWELFLTREADIAHDHVHRDAEEIEHILPAEVVARLEELLEAPTTDPHGRPIPR
ncbi:ABC transporter [bacterium CPR1]|nr:ABC transporter [bacterium CPR1]